MKTFEEKLEHFYDKYGRSYIGSAEGKAAVKVLKELFQAEMDRVVEELLKDTPCDWRCKIAKDMGSTHFPDHRTELEVLKRQRARYKDIRDGSYDQT